jgi:hypothetical protein
MKHGIKNIVILRRILWLDTFLGGVTAVLGLFLFQTFSGILGFTVPFTLSVSAITLLYALMAFILAAQRNISVRLLQVLVSANWIWAVISTVLLLVHFGNALLLGKIFLISQIVVVGGLAYLEGNQIVTRPGESHGKDVDSTFGH